MVGGKRMIEVMNCATQQNSEMSMKEWEEFFIDPERSTFCYQLNLYAWTRQQPKILVLNFINIKIINISK